MRSAAHIAASQITNTINAATLICVDWLPYRALLSEGATNAGQVERNAVTTSTDCLANNAATVANYLRDSVHVARVGVIGGDSQCVHCSSMLAHMHT